jgi:SAM-dependent methyltransferase/methyltransferase-like protein
LYASPYRGMEAAGPAQTAYDEVLYPSSTYPQSHPNRLATVAFLRGVRPAPIDRCRVLELGCGAAGNLIPMAFHLPNSEFVGLDLAQCPIASGQSFVAELGLRNITLYSMDLCQAHAEQLGHFDFIIAHGIYSWVPEPVRERILAICREMLNPQGIAYISYNAYPGNHFRDLARGMMRFHVSRFESPTDKIGQARGLLKFLSESRAQPDYYIEALRAEFARTVKYTDEAFFHDDLNEVNLPFYFYEFMADAKRHGLQFVGEANANELNSGKLTPGAAKRMNELEAADEIVREQFKDFLRACGFRQTLLCHAELELAPDVLVERVPQLYAMCDAVPVERVTSDGSSVAVFRRARGDEIETTHPLIAAAFTFLCSQCPRSVSFKKLLETAKTAVGAQPDPLSEADATMTLAKALAKAYRAGSLLLNVFPPQVINWVGDRPATSELARLQLRRGNVATNQLHISRRFPDPFGRQLVLFLDGTRDREMLARDLIEFAKSTGATVYENSRPVESMAELPAVVERRLPEGLESLAREGMLVS